MAFYTFRNSIQNIMKILNPILIVGIFFLCLVSFTNCNNQDDEIEDLQNQILTLQTQLKQAQDAKSNSDAEVSSLQTQLQNAQAAKSNADALIGELENTIKSLNQKLENSISQEEFELIQSELESASESSSHYFPSEEVEELFNLIYSMLTDIKDILFVQTSYADEQNIDQLKKISNSFLIYIRLFRQGELEFVDFTSAIKQLIDELPERKASNVLYGELNGTTELKAGTEYILDGWVTVPAGSTLRIEAGTVIKAKETTQETISTLIIEPGAKIEANGTAENPIIFTYEGDPITADGTYEEGVTPPEPSLDEQWGGLYILGKAPADPEFEFFGFFGEQYEFGGDDPDDNSGLLRYVSIRHGGSVIENFYNTGITGFVLLGVGSGTIIENVEVVGGLEYGLAIVDSDVNVSGLVVSNTPIEGGIWLIGYRGELDNTLVELNEHTYIGVEISDSFVTGLSNDEKKFTISNISILGPELNSPCQSEHEPKAFLYLYGHLVGRIDKVACTNLITDDIAVRLEEDPRDNYLNGDLSFQDIDVVFSEGCDEVPTVNQFFEVYMEDQNGQFSRDSSSFAELVTAGNEKGADLSQFEWTYWHQTSSN